MVRPWSRIQAVSPALKARLGDETLLLFLQICLLKLSRVFFYVLQSLSIASTAERVNTNASLVDLTERYSILKSIYSTIY